MTTDLSLGHSALPGESDAATALAATDWDFAAAAVDDSIHGLHPYPAKFIPSIPRQLIAVLSHPGDLVLDPFSGGATSGVEALKQGRSFHGIDANPLAILLGRTKTQTLSEEAQASCSALLKRLAAARDPSPPRAWRPTIPNVGKWYAPEIFEVLVSLRHAVAATEDECARELAMLIFANVAAKSSYQESETRYVSKPRELHSDTVLTNFSRDFGRAVRLASTSSYPHGSRAKFVEADARDGSAYPDGVGLAVTSPPYPNAFDYHLYHRFRLFWLGPGPMSLRSTEIGSHLKHQSEVNPSASYAHDMAAVMTNVWRALLPGAYFVLVVGDGIYRGVPYQTSQKLTEMAREIGYELATTMTRQLPTHRRSVTSAGRRLQNEQIVVLRRPEAQG